MNAELSGLGRFARFSRLRLVRFFRCGFTVIKGDRLRVAVVLGLASTVSLLEAALFAIMASLLARTGGGHLRTLPFGLNGLEIEQMLGLGGLLVLGMIAANFPLARQLARLCGRASLRLRENLVRAYHASTVAYRDRHREGFLLQLAGEYVSRAESLVQFLVMACVQGIALLIFLTMAVLLAPGAAGLLMASFLLCFLIAAPSLVRRRRFRRDHTVHYRELLTEIGQSGRLSDEIASFGVRAEVADALSPKIRQGAVQLERIRYEGRLFPALVLGTGLALILGLVSLSLFLFPEGLVLLVPLLILFFRAATYLRGGASAIQNGMEFVDTTELVLSEMALLRVHAQPEGGLPLSNFPGLAFQQVSYAYTGGHDVLESADFTLAPGETLGVIGSSGSGKSTLASLVMRLRKPTGGRILAGAHDLDAVSPAAWARLSAFVSQDSRLIHGSVADNILFFRANFSRAQIKAAACAAHIDADIAAMPHGYNTIIGPGARGLSGGQRQRIAIARALLASPSLLVLDEPTSALDELSEQLVAQTLRELKGATTIVLITHRAAPLGVCDRVLKLEGGRLFAAAGTGAMN